MLAPRVRLGTLASRLTGRRTLSTASFGLTAEQQDLVGAIDRFCGSEVAPIAAQVDDSAAIPASLWRKLGSLGLLGITAPSEFGGAGLGYLEHVLAMEAISRASASVGLSYGAHSNLCVNQIVRNGSAEQKAKYLPGLLSGELIGALAMSEPEAGSDVMSMRCTAIRDGRHYVLSGSKMWVTNGPVADLVVVYARTAAREAAGKTRRSLSAFLVEGRHITRRGEPLRKLGMRGSGTCELFFESVRIPATALIGREGDGARILMSGLDYERLILSAGPLGIMQACLDAVLPYVHTRKQFGQPIGSFQLIQGKIADMYCRLQSSRSFAYSVARHADCADTASTADCAAVILQAAESATAVALDAVQCFGGNGYIEEYPLGRYLRDAKLYEIGAGTSEIRRMLIARELAKPYVAASD